MVWYGMLLAIVDLFTRIKFCFVFVWNYFLFSIFDFSIFGGLDVEVPCLASARMNLFFSPEGEGLWGRDVGWGVAVAWHRVGMSGRVGSGKPYLSLKADTITCHLASARAVIAPITSGLVYCTVCTQANKHNVKVEESEGKGFLFQGRIYSQLID